MHDGGLSYNYAGGTAMHSACACIIDTITRACEVSLWLPVYGVTVDSACIRNFCRQRT